MYKRVRIPIIDEIIDSCKLLPEIIQGLLLGALLVFSSILAILGFKNIILTIVIIEAMLILILVQKNIIYQWIRNIDNAIKYGVIWIKTENDRSKKERYLTMGFIFLLISGLISWYFNLAVLEKIAVTSPSVLYSLKGLFYIPLASIKQYKEGYYEFSNDKINFEFDGYGITSITVNRKFIEFIGNDKQSTIKLDIIDSREVNKLKKFFKGIFINIPIN